MEEFKFLSYKIETSTARGVKIIFAYNHHHLSTKQESLTRKKNQANKILFFTSQLAVLDCLKLHLNRRRHSIYQMELSQKFQPIFFSPDSISRIIVVVVLYSLYRCSVQTFNFMISLLHWRNDSCSSSIKATSENRIWVTGCTGFNGQEVN